MTYKAPLKARLKPLWLLPVFLTIAGGRGHALLRYWWGWLFISALIVTCLTFLCKDSFAEVTLFDDRIEKKTWFGTTTVFRHELTGIQNARAGRAFLALRDTNGPRLSIPRAIEEEAAWKDWVAHLPDVSAR